MKGKIWSRDIICIILKALYKKDPCLFDIRSKHPKLYNAACKYYKTWSNALEASGIDFKLLCENRTKTIRETRHKDKILHTWEGRGNVDIINNFIDFQTSYRHNTAKSINHYISALKYLFNYLRFNNLCRDIINIQKDDITALFISLNRKNVSTRKYLYYDLNRFFKYCCFVGYIKENPIDPFLRPRYVNYSAPKILSQKELSDVMANIEKIRYQSKFIKSRNTLMFYLNAYCGLRTNEMANLKLEDINISGRTINIVNTKYGKSRILPINNLIYDQLRKYMIMRKNSAITYLFINNYQYAPISRGSIYDSISRIGENIIGKKTNPRALRHYFASSLLSKNVNLFAIRDLMGHSDLKTTSKYMYISPDYLRKEIRKHPLYKNLK